MKKISTRVSLCMFRKNYKVIKSNQEVRMTLKLRVAMELSKLIRDLRRKKGSLEITIM